MADNVTDMLRKHLIEIASSVDSDSYQALQLSEWSNEFEFLMRNRLIVGSLRYSKLKTPRASGHTVFILNLIKERLDVYNKTGNLEMLVDIANMCLIEFHHSDHSLKHFCALERNEKGELKND